MLETQKRLQKIRFILYYHPLYCIVLGHTIATNANCGVKNKTPSKRKVITVILKSMKIDRELVLVQEIGTWNVFLNIVVD